MVLSARTTDLGVNRATKGLFASANTPAAKIELDVARVSKHIRTIGLFNTKAKNFYNLSKILLEPHGGEVHS